MSEYLTVSGDDCTKLAPIGGLPRAAHVFEADAILAVNAASAAGRPLLVRGEPGTGKTQLARAVAHELGRAFIPKTVDSRSEARDLLWSFDAVGRLAEAQALGASAKIEVKELRAALDERLFVRPGPLWWAFDWSSAAKQLKSAKVAGQEPETPKGWQPSDGCVVLIDEIDKADSSVPNGLLEALGSSRFDVPGSDQGVARIRDAPATLVVVTTNEERALPDAFLRRCLVLQLRLPAKADELREWLVARGRAHFPNCGQTVLEEAARQLVRDREAVLRRGLSAPGQAEYLDLIRAVEKQRKGDSKGQLDLLREIGRFVLDKHPRDPTDEARDE